MNRLSKIFGLIIFLSQLIASAHADQNLTFAVYAADKPTEMVAQFRPVLDLLEQSLSKKLGEPVKIKMQVASDYLKGQQWMVDGTVDFAQVGPASYVQIKEKNPNVSILAIETEKGGKQFNGLICVKNSSSIKKVGELRGKSFAFGDEYSTIGRYLSQQILLHEGIKASDLKEYKYLGRHDLVGSSVASGQYDAGALKEGTFKKLVAQGADLRVLESFKNVTKPWVASSKLSSDLQAAIRQALLEIKDEKALTALGQDGFTEGSDSDFEVTRQAVSENEKFHS